MSFVDQLERGLLEAGRRRRRRPELGAVVAAGSALVAVVVAVVALASLGHAGRSGHRAGAPVPAGARPLVALLAVLQRPQTPADRALADRYGDFPIGWGSIIPSLTRRAGVLPDGARVYLVVSSPPQGAADDEAGLVVDARGGKPLPTGGLLSAAELERGLADVLQTHGYNLAINPGRAPNVNISRAGRNRIAGVASPPYGTTKLLAQVNLITLHGAPDGVAQIVRRGSTLGIIIVARDVPANPRHTAYAVWLCNRGWARCLRLGFITPRVGANGRLHTQGVLPPSAPRYSELVISLERSARPRTPHQIALSGTIPRL